MASAKITLMTIDCCAGTKWRIIGNRSEFAEFPEKPAMLEDTGFLIKREACQGMLQLCCSHIVGALTGTYTLV
jgi:hypothetical protein